METLMGTSFFELMTGRDGEHPLTEVTLVTAYKEFIATIEQTFHNAEKSAAFFTFTNTQIELLQIQEDCKNSDTKKNIETGNYLNKAILMLNHTLVWLQNTDNQPVLTALPENEPPNFDYYWTGTKIDLLEMAYSLHATDSINNGHATITEIVVFLFTLFGMKPPCNFSSTYGIMRMRPESRTQFLDQMKKALELKMDMNDEKERMRKKHH
jgi:hypothetical protein